MKFKLLISILLFPFLSFAQQEKLDLSKALESALYNNFQILISGKQVEKAENNNQWGEAGRYPTVSFNTGQNNQIQQQNNPTSFINGLSLRTHSIAPNIDASWTIFEGFKVNITKEQLATLQEQSEGNADLIIQNTLQSVIMGYYEILLEEINLNVLRETYHLSRDKYRYENEKKKLGVSTTFDLLQTQTNMLTDSSTLETQKLNVKNAYRNLNLLMGIDSETQYQLAEDSLISDLKNYEYDDLQAKMLSNNQNVINQVINLRLSKVQADLSRSELYPKLRLNLGGDYNISQIYLGDQTTTGNSWDVYANFTLSWTLSNGRKIRRRIENADIDIDIAQLEQKELQLELKKELRSALDQYNLNKHLIEINRSNLKTALLQLDLASERQKNGTINSIDYRNIQLNTRNVALQLYTNTFQLIQSETELVKLIGGLVAEL